MNDIQHSIHAGYDANGAVCRRGDLRLMGTIDQNDLAGRMELCDETGEWKSVCGNKWSEQDARVACRQMGYSAKGAYI